MGGVPRLGLAVLLGAVWMLVGCAALRPGTESPPEPGAEVRPDASAEYDVLVAQQFEVDGRVAEALAAYQRAVAKDEGSALLHRKVAELLVRQSRLEEALEHAKRAVELEPGDVPTRIFLAQLHRLRRDPEAAARALTDESGEPIDEDAAFLLHRIRLESGRPEEGLRIAEDLVESDPTSLRARLALANAYRRLGRQAEAEAALRDALELEPGNLRAFGALARSLRERGERDAEIELYRDALEIFPHHRPTLLALAEAQIAVGDRDGATRTYEQVEAGHSDDPRVSVRLAFLYYEARRFAEAAERFERVLQASPQDYEMAFYLGVARRRGGANAEAIEAFGRIPPEHDHYARARTQIAAILEHRGDFSGALDEVERAAAVEPSRELDLYMATLRSKAGDFEGAVAQLEELLRQQPGDDELLYNLGVLYGEAKRTDESIRYMERALEANPDNASALNYLGYSWAERGVRLDEAETMIEHALELRPDDGFITDSLGWVYYMRARALLGEGRAGEAQRLIQDALRMLERADELTGGDPVVSEHLGDTYLLLDKKRKALDKFEEAVRLEPREGEQPDLFEKLETLRREFE